MHIFFILKIHIVKSFIIINFSIDEILDFYYVKI